MLSASADSIRLWLTRVFPSLFPFLAACGILLRTGAAEKSGKYLSPLMKPVFGLNGIAAFPFFLGMLSGYPMGAKITAELYEQQQISLEEAQHILVFSNNPGPLFLIGTIGTGFFGIPQYGYLLLFSSFFRSVLTGMLIGGYLILFAALSEGLEQTGLIQLLSGLLFFLPVSAETLHGCISGALEMTNGAWLLSQSADPLRLRLTLVSFLVSFGGCSILGQTLGVLSSVPINKKTT